MGSGVRCTQSEFIKKVNELFGDKYDFSKAVYTKAHNNVVVGCKVHGDVLIAPVRLFKGCGCPKCGKEAGGAKRRVTKEDFVKKAIGVHGDAYLYDETVIEKITSPITFKCKNCGNNTTLPQARLHLEQGRGCDVCSGVRPKSQNTEIFLKRLFMRTDRLQGYDFSEFKYSGTQTKSRITCDSGHTFYATPNTLMTGTRCPHCAKEAKAGKKKNWTRKPTGRPVAGLSDEDFVRMLERNIYIDTKQNLATGEKVKAVCLKCDFEWESRLSSLKGGTGCPECGKNCMKEKLAIPFEEAVKRAFEIYGNEYFYVRDTYLDMKTPLTIVCKEHGPFRASMQSHCRSVRPVVCRFCHPTKYGFNKHKPATLYYCKIDHGGNFLYKVGITNRSLDDRFWKSDKEKMSVVNSWYFEDGGEAYRTEQMILKEHSEFLASAVDVLESGGNTEIFSVDIFE